MNAKQKSIFKNPRVHTHKGYKINMKNLGMPYRGSKRKLAPEIINFIIKKNPNVKHIYDLFGGGGAISFFCLQHPQFKTVHYNELNTAVVILLKDIIKNGISDKYYQWIDRDTFNENKDKKTWLGGLCSAIWSFSNNQKDYLFSKDIENEKKLLHNIIVYKCDKSVSIFEEKTGVKLSITNPQSSMFDETINERRLRIMQQYRNCIGRCDIEQLQQLEQLQRLQQLEQLQRLQRLEQLQRLQRLEQLERLQITNKSYSDVEIKTNTSDTIIYLDPPYFKTAGYRENICHKELYDYIEKSKYKIYMSSYESDLKQVLSIKHRSTLKDNKEVIERLYTNDVSELR